MTLGSEVVWDQVKNQRVSSAAMNFCLQIKQPTGSGYEPPVFVVVNAQSTSPPLVSWRFIAGNLSEFRHAETKEKFFPMNKIYDDSITYQ